VRYCGHRTTDITCATVVTELRHHVRHCGHRTTTSRALLCSPNYRYQVLYCVHRTTDIMCATVVTELRHHVRYYVHRTTDITCATVVTELPISRALLWSLNPSNFKTVKTADSRSTQSLCSGDIGPHGAGSIRQSAFPTSVDTQEVQLL
jgi:hypothetical protein